MAPNTESFLFLTGIIVIIAFFGQRIFQRTKIPDVVMLILLGVVLGPLPPLLPFGDFAPLLDPVLFADLLPLLGAVAITVVLFDGGLKLNPHDLFIGVAPATFLSLIGFIVSVLLTTALLLFFNVVEDPVVGLILGSIVGGTSSVVVMPVVEAMGLNRRTKTILGLESALTDVLVIVGTISLSIAVAAALFQPEALAQEIVRKFAVGIGIGLVSGFMWTNVLRRFTERSFEYMMTLALLLISYAATEFFQGSGPIAVLAFGLVLGNSAKAHALEGKELAMAELKHESRFKLSPLFNPELRSLHEEIVFFVRSFFFVAMGVVLDLELIANARFLLISLLLLIGLLAARWLSVTLVFWRQDVSDREKKLMWFLIPRGLAAAALAGVPFAVYDIQGARDFIGYAVVILLLSNIVTTVAVALYENKGFQHRLEAFAEQRSARHSDRAEARGRRAAQREVQRWHRRQERREARDRQRADRKRDRAKRKTDQKKRAEKAKKAKAQAGRKRSRG